MVLFLTAGHIYIYNINIYIHTHESSLFDIFTYWPKTQNIIAYIGL